MDNQKRIEEVAKDMLEYGMGKYPTGESGFTETKLREQFYHVFLTYAEHLIKIGYRKIPEGAVVLTGTETEERLEDLLVDFDEMSFFPATLTPNPEEYAREWKRKLIYAIGQLRKETAKEILQGFNKWLNQAISISYEKSVNGSVRYGGMNNAFHEVKELVKKVAEEKGVEVE